MAKNIVICGLHSVQAYLDRHPEGILEVFLLKGRDDERMNKLVKGLRPLGVTLQWRERGQLDELAGDAHHQGAVARVREQAPGDENDLVVFLDGLEAPPFLLLLDGVTDPHNLGACLRSADAAGIHAVITPRDKSASITPVVRKVAVGAADSMPFFQVTNLARTMEMLKERGIWLMGTALEEEAKSLYDVALTGPIGIIMGAEGSGMRRLTRELCDVLLYIPMGGSVESLNVSVATGVTLFEAMRQRTRLKS
ncbi:MAG: 23S rRNA (guanosine(2251)-2'-O)-methyltransferase RlmB [Moraxellaceae bacterium]|jgi:23S rRNA (guanosine2251-2'-O)-methyltransferase|nr:23S rRNA (guanosine(2251)-2'-O)-methyltransferase RlmB [Moraxellaceae bacterium]MBP8852022.1 23S rRNA (guanosine(2251)-2'-O)-methyltransferase RlmB [Moraxellaceae bacterium]MBP9045643.1 23S rRNA (guanosine(2251)-2'-O)-methyltransferase RlmB [Moraxellaceae bacterium]MBP9731296.1 23S rRNA (guanosine(2251)-2'-O)-methyltransferase RlmB [Moraxellaceae bacterium]MCC6199307.1 23S rRNA (guanosine(2251)-2'-O)-methyltransferase RlmB [Moraxellaceae bacterium]